MRAVVTGCAGFIGSHLCERLTAEGWRVTGVDAFTPYYDVREKEANLGALVGEHRFDLVRADLAATALDDLFSGRPAIVHLAAQPGVRGSFGPAFEQYVHDNVLATQRVFEAAHRGGCRRVVYASSSSVYGDAPRHPSVEDVSPTLPRSPYGVTKRTCELLGDVYRQLGLETVGLRYFTVYGARQRPDMAIRRLCETALGGPTFQLHGDGRQSRDFTHVDDAVDATVRAMRAPHPSGVLNIGGGQEASMQQVIATLEAFSGDSIPVERTAPSEGDVRRTGADTSRARRELGWTPTVSLTDGLRGSLEWVARRHGHAAVDRLKGHCVEHL